jgi:transposase
MALKTEIFVKEDVDFLKKRLSLSSSLKIEKRIKCLLLLKTEKHVYRQDLAKDLMITPRTLERWINKYNQGGLDKLLSFERTKKVSSQITPEIHQALEKRLFDAQNCFLSYKEALDWLNTTYDFQMKYEWFRGYLIKHFKTKLKVPRKSHVQKDEEEVISFKKTAISIQNNQIVSQKKEI